MEVLILVSRVECTNAVYCDLQIYRLPEMTLHFDCGELGLAPSVLMDSSVCALSASVERSALLSLGLSPDDAASSEAAKLSSEDLLGNRHHMIEEMALVPFDCKLFLFV